MKRLALLLGVALLCASSMAQEAGGEAPKTIVSVQEVKTYPDVETRRYTGLIVSPAAVSLVSRVAGDLVAVRFAEGDFVHKGQVLYQIDDIRYEAAVKSSEASISQYEARVAYSKSNFERVNALYEKAVSTRDAMENALSDYKANEAALAAAKAALVLAKDDLAHTRIVSPIDGKIGVTNFTAGNYVSLSSGVLATVVQLDPIRVKFSISNRDFLQMFGNVSNLKAQSRVRIVMADDRDYSIGGTVAYGSLDFVDNMANRTTDTVQLFYSFSNPDFALIPQSTVKVILEKQGADDVAGVSPTAVMHDNGGAFVYVVDEAGTIARRNVTLGNLSGDVQLLAEGVSAGEIVVVEGTHKVRPGMPVDARPMK